jgi:hypothetical protein
MRHKRRLPGSLLSVAERAQGLSPRSHIGRPSRNEKIFLTPQKMKSD